MSAKPGELHSVTTGDFNGDGKADLAVANYSSNNVSILINSGPVALTVSKSGTGSGTVTSEPAGISCGSDCSEIYNENTVVTLTATPDSGSTFTDWSGDADCSDGSVTMSADKTCIATFNLLIPNISSSVPSLNFGNVNVGVTSASQTVTVTNTGTGNLLISTAAITGTNFSEYTKQVDTCSGNTFSPTQTCQIQVVFNPTSAGAKTGTLNIPSDDPDTSTLNIPLSGTGTVQQYTLTIEKTGSGTVTATGINCGSDCSEVYTSGTIVTLSPTPDTGSTFTGWTGCASVSGNTCDITMNSDKTITATFISSALYVVWSDDSYGNNEIFLKKSTDGGNTWAFQRLTTNTGNSQVPAIAVNGNEVYVVWQDDTYGPTGVPEIFLKRSADSGATWQFQRMTTNAGYSGRPSMAVDGSNIYVVWPDDTYGNYEIFLKKSTDGGSTWLFQRLTTNAGISGRPSIALSSGNLYVVWEDNTYGNAEIFFKKSIDGGNTWLFQRLTTNTGVSMNPALRVNGTDVYAVWQDDTYGPTGVPEIFLKRSADSGATWQFQRLTTNTGNSVMPAMPR